MKKLKIIICTVLSAFTLLSSTACDKNTSSPQNEVITFILPAEPLSLDPQIADDYSSNMLIVNIFEGLVRKSTDNTIIPGIAKSWDITDEGLTYTFHLYENTKWSSGAPVTANDFRFGMLRALNPETRAENVSNLFVIKNAAAYYNGECTSDECGITAIDDNTLEIRLEYESNALLSTLTESVCMPCCEEFFNTTGGKYGKDSELIITNGPFQIRELYGWEHDKYIYIRRSENYHAANEAVPMGVNFNIVQQTVTDPVDAIVKNETDISEIYGYHLPKANENDLSVTATANTLWGICYNTDIPAFKNAKLRVSLLGSLSRGTLLSSAPDTYVKANLLIGDNVMFAGKNYRDSVGEIRLEQEDIAEIMFKKAAEELSDKGIELKSSYTIICPDDDATSVMVTSIIEAFNKTSSCYFNKQPLPRNELIQRINDRDYEIAIAPLNSSADSPMEFLSRFTSDSSDNYIGLNYPAYNEFIQNALLSTGSGSISFLGQAESYLINYGYLYPLYYEKRYFAFKNNISGAIFSDDGESVDFTKAVKITGE